MADVNLNEIREEINIPAFKLSENAIAFLVACSIICFLMFFLLLIS